MAQPTHSTISTAPEAFAAVALAAVACDGELASLEARSLRQQLEFRHPYRDWSDAAMVASEGTQARSGGESCRPRSKSVVSITRSTSGMMLV